MTIQPNPVPESGDILFVPLNKLKASPKNARKTPHTPADIEALAGSIAVKDMIQPPVIEPERDAAGAPTGFYLVTAGEGRRQAMLLRARRKEIGKAHPVRCIVDATHDPFEISLDENVTRFAMHPADQFEAFQKLADDQGFGPEEIAARFGVTPTVVRQRLRLATVSPNLIAAYRAGEMNLDQLMAFTLTSDATRQEAVWASLSWNKEPSLIRRLLVEDRVPARDRRARLVGADAYLEAGGVIERDLFSEDYGGFFADPVLLERLALERLVAMTDELRDQGWKWVSASLDLPPTHGLRRVYPSREPLSDEDEARRTALQADYDTLVAEHEDDDELEDEVATRLEALASDLHALNTKGLVYDADDLARAGVFVVLGQDGAPRIERGFVRPEDEPRQADPDRDAEAGERTSDDEDVEREHDAPRPISERLIADLTAHRTGALQDKLAAAPNVALVAVVHALALQAFGWERAGPSCLQLHLVAADLSPHAPAVPGSLAGRNIEARQAAWAAELPKGRVDLWGYLTELPVDRLLDLLAHCASLSLNAVQISSHRAAALDHADLLAAALQLDMADYWTPTIESYLGRVSKGRILEAVEEGAGPDQVRRIEGLKKQPMAESAEGLLAESRWLPEPLRRPEPPPERRR